MRTLSQFVPILFPLIVASVVNAQPAGAPPPAAAPSAPTASASPVEDLTQTVQTSPPAPEPAPVTSAQPAANQSPQPTPQPVVAQSFQTSQPIAPAEPVPAATESIHRGFYMRLGNGLGLVSLAGDGPRGHASIRSLGGLNTIALGGSIARGVVLAGAIITSAATAKFSGGPYEGRSIDLGDRTVSATSKADAAFTQMGLLVDWYPDPVGGWHVGASAGFGIISVLNRADDDTNNSLLGSSLGGTLFGGYDWSIGKAWSLGIALTASGTKSVTMKYADDSSDSGYRLRCGAIGVQGSILYF